MLVFAFSRTFRSVLWRRRLKHRLEHYLNTVLCFLYSLFRFCFSLCLLLSLALIALSVFLILYYLHQNGQGRRSSSSSSSSSSFPPSPFPPPTFGNGHGWARPFGNSGLGDIFMLLAWRDLTLSTSNPAARWRRTPNWRSPYSYRYERSVALTAPTLLKFNCLSGI